MKKIVSFLSLLITPFLLLSCSKPNAYVLLQPYESIDTIEIVDITIIPPLWDDSDFKEECVIDILATIEKTQWDSFLHDLLLLPRKQHFGDPPGSIEGYAVRITYADKTIEMIGVDSICHIYSNGKTYYPYYYCEKVPFMKLINPYITTADDSLV